VSKVPMENPAILCVGGIDLVEDREVVLGWVVGDDVSAQGEAAQDDGGDGHNA